MIYLDNAATTQVSESVRDIVSHVMCEEYGNPSSMHRMGVLAEQQIKTAKGVIANLLKIEPKEIYFTSGGTESNNMALIGAANANRRSGNHIITTEIEHPSVAEPLKYLEQEGFRITRLPVDATGKIHLEDLRSAITSETILISIIYVNNEIGIVQPIEEISKLIKEIHPETIFHVDAIQAFGKYKIYPKKMGIDMMSVSAHKIHGPKGMGMLFANQKIKLKPILWGGGQQAGMRSGTENVPGIAGISEAVKECYETMTCDVENMYQRKEQLIQGVLKIPGVSLNGLSGKESAPHIVSFRMDGVRSQVLLNSLEDDGIYVSSGSACASHKSAISDTLKGIGITAGYLKDNAVLRFSFSRSTTEEEIETTIKALHTVLPKLRGYQRK